MHYVCERESSPRHVGRISQDITATVSLRMRVSCNARVRTVVYLHFVVHCRVAPARYALSVRCTCSLLNPAQADMARCIEGKTRKSVKGMRARFYFR